MTLPHPEHACLAYSSPLGCLHLLASPHALVHVYLPDELQPADYLTASPSHSILNHAKQELDSYFAGVLTTFTTPLAPQGTAFQQCVWDACRQVSYGKTVSYRDLADSIATPRHARAVGMALNRNPIPLFIPCHRIVGTGGNMTGYRGGLAAKGLLLYLEHNLNTQ